MPAIPSGFPEESVPGNPGLRIWFDRILNFNDFSPVCLSCHAVRSVFTYKTLPAWLARNPVDLGQSFPT